MPTLSSVLIALLAALFLAGPLLAGPKPALPLVTVEFPPFHYQEEGAGKGFVTEIVARTAAEMGYAPEIRFLPTQRAKLLAETGRAAGVFAFTKNPQRERKYLFTRPLATIRDVFFKRKSDPIAWSRLEDLAPYRIGATATYNYAPHFMQAIRDGVLKVDMISAQAPEMQHLRKLAAGRIDLAICEVSLCGSLVEKHGKELEGIDFINKAIGPTRTFHMGVSRKWPGAAALVKKFDAALIRLEEQGVVSAIQSKYGVGQMEVAAGR